MYDQKEKEKKVKNDWKNVAKLIEKCYCLMKK